MNTHTPAGGSDLASLSDEQILRLIELAAHDRYAAHEVLHLQKQAIESVGRAIQDMQQALSELEPHQDVASGPVSVAALTSAARARESAGRQKRDLAQNLIIGALINKNNPDWSPLDQAEPPASARERNGVLALLQLPPPQTTEASGANT